MTAYVITVPGTFLTDVPAAVREELAQRLRPADPVLSDLGQAQELDLLTVNEDGTFCLRLEVEAADQAHAEAAAVRIAESALADAGLAERDAPLGPPAVTGIDSGG
ncbi:hypothetical protein ACFWBN_14220 [Streptomyces sp. NPDC059989]|uniref:hypothetical protein n=1 Tax=Streptomyces sp. NPDC059989 TaxID=3347026 RepID=UPI00368C9BA5